MSGATARRTLVVIALAASPTAILGWVGCSSSSSSPAGVVRADPGGTYGAEVHVTVIGRGHVVSDYPGIDCPNPQAGGACFKSYTFTDSTQDGASGGVKLSAKIVEGSTFKFTGWKFDTTTPIGSHGRGPDTCNPISRPGVAPSGDTSGAEITLPFGQANGAPPAGQESSCAPYTGVPVAYNVTATFIDTDAGFDAGPPDLFYQGASTGAARELALFNGRLYWRFQSGANQGIATGLTTVSGMTPPLMPQVIVSATQPLPVFRFDSNTVFQTSLGTLSYITPGSTVPQQLSGAGTCVGVASDTSNIYCKTSTGLLQQWQTFSVSAPNVWYSGLTISTGSNEMASDGSTFGYIYFVDDPGTPGSAAIRRLPKPSTFDGGAPTVQDVATLRPGAPFGLTTYSSFSRLYWMESAGGGATGFEATATSSTLVNTLTTSTPGLKALAIDTLSSSFVYFATSGAAGGDQILRTSSTSSGLTAICRSNINGLGGLAVDSQFIYWTQADGGIYRTAKTNCL